MKNCPTGATCNDKTNHCVQNDQQCAGLPCKYNQDCPTAHTCNDALGACVRTN